MSDPLDFLDRMIAVPPARPRQAKRKRPEQSLQMQVAGYLSWCLKPPAWFTAFPAGGGGYMRGQILRATGLKAGVPDIYLATPSGTCWIELKAPREVLSDVQKRTHAALLALGHRIAVCKSLDEVKGALEEWQIPTRETKPNSAALRQAIASAG